MAMKYDTSEYRYNPYTQELEYVDFTKDNLKPLEIRVSDNENNITTNSNDINTNSNNITTNRNDINSNVTNITTNSNNINTNSNDIQGIKTKFNNGYTGDIKLKDENDIVKTLTFSEGLLTNII